MTDQQTPDLEALNAALAPVREAWADTVDAFRNTWEAMKPLVAVAVESAEIRAAAQDAIGHAYDEEPERLVAHLRTLTPTQRRAILTAAVRLDAVLSDLVDEDITSTAEGTDQ